MSRSSLVFRSSFSEGDPNSEAETKLLDSTNNSHIYPSLSIMGNFSKDEIYPGEMKIIDKTTVAPTVSQKVEENGEKVEKIEIENEEKEKCHKKFQTWTKIVWSFISFVISVADVFVILYLSYIHFSHSSDIAAWLMLLPILLNFIGMFTFLSDDDERHEMEALGCQNPIWKNLMFMPVLGPSVCSLNLFVMSWREHHKDRFERLESLTIRMKQYESFFRAAPEAFVQLTFRVITWSRSTVIHSEDYWTNVCLILCFFALAESHMYSTVVPYYRMFQRNKKEDAWSVEFIPNGWRAACFFLTFLSVASRLYAEAIFKATVCFYFHNYSFGEVMIVTFLLQFVSRAALHWSFVSCFGSKRQQNILKETGVYGAFTYSWRSLFMSFDFQSHCKLVYLAFYLENFILVTFSYTVILTLTDVDLKDKWVFNLYACFSILSIFITMTLRCLLKPIWVSRMAGKIEARK